MGIESVSGIEPAQIEWLWHPFVPIGKITDVAGQMGQAKSLFTIWLAAKVTRECGSVLMYAGEDDYGDTVRPRLEAAGADLDRVHRVTDNVLDTKSIAGYCEELGDVRLITVDPITAYFAKGFDPWRTPEVRQFLLPFAELASTERFSLVGIQHVNRRSDGEALARIADAQGIPQVARSVLIFGPDPSDPAGDAGDLKVLATAKNNNVAGRPAASFVKASTTVAKGITSVRVEHKGESAVQASEVVADHETRTLAQDATEWLRENLSQGDAEAKIVEGEATAAGITSKSLRTARERIAVSGPARPPVLGPVVLSV
jgi:putative DNA primase/helicase